MFKVGDRVRVRGSFMPDIVGKTATVVKGTDTGALVYFDDDKLHRFHTTTTGGRGRRMRAELIEIIVFRSPLEEQIYSYIDRELHTP